MSYCTCIECGAQVWDGYVLAHFEACHPHDLEYGAAEYCPAEGAD